MEILKIIELVLNYILITEIVAVALYNLVFVPKSASLRRMISILFFAFVFGILGIYLLAVNNVALNGGSDPSFGWNLIKGLSVLIDIFFVYVLSSDIYKEVREIISIRSKRNKAVN